VRAAIERASATLLYLPPYKPDFNPIETAFTKLKVLLRKAAARTIAELWDARRDTLPKFSPAECANDLAAAGNKPDSADSALANFNPAASIAAEARCPRR